MGLKLSSDVRGQLHEYYGLDQRNYKNLAGKVFEDLESLSGGAYPIPQPDSIDRVLSGKNNLDYKLRPLFEQYFAGIDLSFPLDDEGNDRDGRSNWTSFDDSLANIVVKTAPTSTECPEQPSYDLTTEIYIGPYQSEVELKCLSTKDTFTLALTLGSAMVAYLLPEGTIVSSAKISHNGATYMGHVLDESTGLERHNVTVHNLMTGQNMFGQITVSGKMNGNEYIELLAGRGDIRRFTDKTIPNGPFPDDDELNKARSKLIAAIFNDCCKNQNANTRAILVNRQIQFDDNKHSPKKEPSECRIRP